MVKHTLKESMFVHFSTSSIKGLMILHTHDLQCQSINGPPNIPVFNNP